VTDEPIRDIARLQHRMADLERLISSAFAAAPIRSTGTESSGMISVTLGADGLPQSFHIARHWRRRLTPGNIGQAVLEAFWAALAERMRVWSRNLAEQRWREEFDEHRTGPPAMPAVDPTGDRTPGGLPRTGSTTTPRSADTVAEDVIKALDRAEHIAAVRQPTGTGSDDSGSVTLTLSGTGLVFCTVDERWATRRTAVMLTKALGQALVAGRADLARQADRPPPSATFSDLTAEALELLDDQRRGNDF
jgi:hypothetical protein